MIVMNDFKKEYSLLAKEINFAIDRVLESGWYILGKEVESFESEFADYTGLRYCVAVANGLEALQIALLALDIGKGDEVITVSNTAVATVLAITNIGAKPVFVDVNDFYLMDTGLVEEKITSNTKAIIPVHLYGQMCDMTKLKSLAKKYNLKIIEDSCQAHGATQSSKKAGSFGNLGCFSFYPTKNLGAYGDGGAIVTNSKTLAEKCKILRNYGQSSRYLHKVRGLNSRLDEIQACILRVKLKHLDVFNIKREILAQIYFKNLSNVDQIKLPEISSKNNHIFHLFVIQAKNRDKLMMFLQQNKIESLIHYPIPVHKQESYKKFNQLKLNNTEYFANQLVSLPINPFLTKSEIYDVCKKIKEFYSS